MGACTSLCGLDIQPPTLTPRETAYIAKTVVKSADDSKDLNERYDFTFKKKQEHLKTDVLETLHSETMKDYNYRNNQGYAVHSLFERVVNEVTEVVWRELRQTLLQLVDQTSESVKKMPDGLKSMAAKRAVKQSAEKMLSDQLKKRGQLILTPEEKSSTTTTTTTTEEQKEVQTEQVKVEEKPQITSVTNTEQPTTQLAA
eukprot:TRINITY_DN535_c0_g1_i1.p1 TRINITY_DN535_c0_g1~~TRINITY_DN535_c0_g1_i1.p1  ORF type:complete len:207 (-),score=36.09 TRINITY_DN535_c0_g1_i1:204-803(-)